MELSKGELEKVLAQQADRVAKEAEERMKGYVHALTEDSEERMKGYLDGARVESEERMKIYIGGLKEDFDHKLDVVMEYVQEIPAIKEKQDMMFEKIGEMAIEIEVIKEAVADHSVRLEKVEAKVAQI